MTLPIPGLLVITNNGSVFPCKKSPAVISPIVIKLLSYFNVACAAARPVTPRTFKSKATLAPVRSI